MMRIRVALLALVVALSGFGVAQASPAARFLAGAAVRSISPIGADQETHVGGYGTCLGCPTTRVRAGDDLQARAFFVSDATRAHGVAHASVDLEGWFAGYQQEFLDADGPFGITPLRQEVAATIKAEYPALTIDEGDIIVQTNHCHACPTVIGLWGPTNTKYLRRVYDQTRDAILAAARQALSGQMATLTWAVADGGFVNNITIGQANSNEGWEFDAQMPVLQARDPDTDQVIFTWANEPAHENIAHGPSLPEMTSGYFGAASRWLTLHFGGVGIASAATLGDETSPMQGDSARIPNTDGRPTPYTDGTYPRVYDVVDRLGALIGNQAADALARDPHPIYDGTVGGETQYTLLPVHAPLLLALGAAYFTGPDTFGGAVYPIDRSMVPPYFVGDAIGVWFTTLRIGSVAIASEPGEAFPMVTNTIRRALIGAEVVFTPGNAQDQLGYYYEPWAFPHTVPCSADHHIFWVSPVFAQANIQVQTVNAKLLGFEVSPDSPTPRNNDYGRLLRPGIQFIVYPNAPDGPTAGPGLSYWVGVYRAPTRLGSDDPAPATIDYGDGSAPQVIDDPPSPFASNFVQQRNYGTTYTVHTFPGPGTYVVHAAMGEESWDMTVRVSDPYTLTETAHYPARAFPL